MIDIGHYGADLDIAAGFALPDQVDNIGGGVSNHFIVADQGVGNIGVGPVAFAVPLFKGEIEGFNRQVNEALS